MNNAPGLRARVGAFWRSGCLGKLVLGGLSCSGCGLCCAVTVFLSLSMVDFDSLLEQQMENMPAMEWEMPAGMVPIPSTAVATTCEDLMAAAEGNDPVGLVRAFTDEIIDTLESDDLGGLPFGNNPVIPMSLVNQLEALHEDGTFCGVVETDGSWRETPASGEAAPEPSGTGTPGASSDGYPPPTAPWFPPELAQTATALAKQLNNTPVPPPGP